MLGTKSVYRQFDKGKAMGPGLGHWHGLACCVYMSCRLRLLPSFFLSR